MRYTILHILCEGQTEARFVKEVLAPYLQQFSIFSKPIMLLTSKKLNARGGMLNYGQAKRDLSILQKQYRDNQSEHHVFSTMFDYYALPEDFPGYETAERIQDVRERIGFIEERFADDIGGNAFIPYIQLHEFEALLFVDILRLQKEYPKAAKSILALKEVTDAYEDPEMIDNGPNTAPSKRIIDALEPHYHYNKVQSGATITGGIGMEALMGRCHHFREWIEKLSKTSFWE